jgi:hypothetical protein
MNMDRGNYYISSRFAVSLVHFTFYLWGIAYPKI